MQGGAEDCLSKGGDVPIPPSPHESGDSFYETAEW